MAYELGVGTAPGTYDIVKRDTSIESGAQITPVSMMALLAPGQYYSAVRTVAKSLGVEVLSAWSNEVPFMVAPVTPNPPANFSAA